MSVIGEAALSVLFEELFRKIASSEMLNFATEAQVCEEIQGWADKLKMLCAVLDDAEDKQIQSSTSRSVKLWLGKVKHLAYDVEDILDEFATDCLRRKLGGGHQASASTSKIGKLIPACCTSFTPRAVMFNSYMLSKIKRITVKLEGVLEEMKQFNFAENVRVTSNKVSSLDRSTLLYDETTVYGRDGDKEKILELLFRNDIGGAKIGVIPIVGMGGLGKTTLAKLVYNDDSIPGHFDVKAWVCVSDVFDIMRVTKGILESMTSQNSDLKELSQVQLKLEKELVGKKFVLVLDDVWNDNYDNWHTLCIPLMYGAPGSKIIVTTRNADVARMMLGNDDYYELKKMSEDDCWLLFKKHAFGNKSVAQQKLEEISRQIVSERCDGLPLAARSLGGLLRGKERTNEWEEVLNSKMWSVLDNKSNVLPVLELSYYYLPSHLKRCFAYCAILPKDFEFEQEEIVLLWMAEGLISQAKGTREMEDLGGDYFRELLSRSIFQTSSVDQSRFVMHDLVNDLAQKVAGDVCIRLDEEINVGEEFQPERVRHSSYIQGDVDVAKRFAAFRNMQCLRTFLPLSFFTCSYLASCVPNELVKDLKCLRVLSFHGYQIEELPNSIGDLKHLRYLDVSYTNIQVLPESTSLLCNLQTLKLRWCFHLKKLPVRMDNLINLRYLDMRGVRLIEWTPEQMKELSNLKTLIDLDIDNKIFPLSHLSSLKSLRGELSLRNLNTMVDSSDAVKAKLKDKEGVCDLKLQWRSVFSGGEVEGEGANNKGVLDGLQPHQNIEKLLVGNYKGSEFPTWIGDPTFNNIVEVRLENCVKCTLLPQLGMLPNLKELCIEGMWSLERVNEEFYGNNCPNSFPCLEVLHFKEMDNWKEWNGFEFEFRVLRKLNIRKCNNLVAVLPRLPMVRELQITNCEEVDFRRIVDFNSLTRIQLFEISRIKNLVREGFVQRLKKFKQVSLIDSEPPWSGYDEWDCKIGKCPQLMGMVAEEEREQLQMDLAGANLKSLELQGWGMLVNLPTWIQKAVFLKKLRICYYNSLTELTLCNSGCLEELRIENSESLISLGKRQLPPTLKNLIISDCKNLRSLLHEEDEGETTSSSPSINLEYEGETSSSSSPSINLEYEGETSSSSSSSISVEYLKINGCSSLTSISSTRDLPATLKHLTIWDCEKIESIAEGFDTNSSLESFVITSCSTLQSLPEGLHNLIKLCYVRLYDCPCIVSFPKGGLPTTCLTNLVIKKLEKLEALPDNLRTLSSLKMLTILHCPNLMSFPGEGLPSNLTSLKISSKHLFECGLDRLNSLEKLHIYGGIGERRKVLWDKTGTMLLPSLTTLKIRDFPNLKSISSRGFRHLTSLKISDCPKLAFFRKNDLPDSLEHLIIRGCPKLASFPKKGLPNSLLELEVIDCPRMKKRCQEGKISKILHIPEVHFY